jgi:hypothetical protein
VEIKTVPHGADIVKFIQNPPTKVVWSWWKNGKLHNAKTNCSNYNENNKEKKNTKEMETRGVNISIMGI